MFNFFKSDATISMQEFVTLFQQGPIKILDVRETYEYREGHIQGAVNVPLSQIPNYKGKKEKLYVICQSGMRSKQAVTQLKKLGYEAVNVSGGMSHWRGSIKGGN